MSEETRSLSEINLNLAKALALAKSLEIGSDSGSGSTQNVIFAPASITFKGRRKNGGWGDQGRQEGKESSLTGSRSRS